MTELEGFCKKNEKHPALGSEIQLLSKAALRLGEVAKKMAAQSKSDPLQWASYTYPALMCFGDVTMVWRLLDIALIAQRAIDEGKKNEYYKGKVLQATYYTGVTLPLTMARLDTCLRGGREIVEMPEEAF
jgi:hypothetical protein